MTAQIPERLFFEGQEVALHANPLGMYFDLIGSDPGFAPSMTCLWRGYVGKWEIADGKLFLIDLNGSLMDGSRATLVTVFPDAIDKVFANWFTGTIRVPQGQRLKYVHRGFDSIYEKELAMDVQHGVVVATRTHHNVVDDPDREESGDSFEIPAFLLRGARE